MRVREREEGEGGREGEREREREYLLGHYLSCCNPLLQQFKHGGNHTDTLSSLLISQHIVQRHGRTGAGTCQYMECGYDMVY